jgi:hypothetical protein
MLAVLSMRAHLDFQSNQLNLQQAPSYTVAPNRTISTPISSM